MQLMGFITLFLDENTHKNQLHERMKLAIVIIARKFGVSTLILVVACFQRCLHVVTNIV
jgi:hypothetical protein